MTDLVPHIISFIIEFIAILSRLLYYCVLVHILISWFASGRTALGMWLVAIVEPLLAPFRWARIGVLDLSPIILLLLLRHVPAVIIQYLQGLL